MDEKTNEFARRDFLKAAGAITAATVATAFTSHAVAQDNAKSPDLSQGRPADQSTGESLVSPSVGALTKHELPKLEFAFDALEPHIDARTMELHHDVHHLAYVKGLNKAEDELAKARASGDFSLVEYWSKKAAFHGGGHFLHSLFWQTLAPAGKGGQHSPELSKALERDFGSVNSFQAHFSAAAAAVEGGGWALLHFRHADSRLLVLQVENQHKLNPNGTTVLLGCDVWEHAYYLKYQSKRADYVQAWWKVVNWNAVNDQYSRLLKGAVEPAAGVIQTNGA